MQAQRFDMTRLSCLCQVQLSNYVADDTVCALLTQADLLHATPLRRVCLSYVLCAHALRLAVGRVPRLTALLPSRVVPPTPLHLPHRSYILDNFERVSTLPAFIALPMEVIREVLVRRSKTRAASRLSDSIPTPSTLRHRLRVPSALMSPPPSTMGVTAPIVTRTWTHVHTLTPTSATRVQQRPDAGQPPAAAAAATAMAPTTAH
ncbi:MAG: hypothetical protein EOO65_00915 [Methanosarcinales archaeon]|nr:MAG: hypothetical protein EOO65_00915 [Methanosarcinales archaeon]